LHVWRASLDWEPELVGQLFELLGDDERHRAARFRFERDRSRFITGRALLRMLLSRYAGMPAADIRFHYGPYDKPQLAATGPWFNLSHSGGIALFALSSRAELGIDIEVSTPDFPGERIAEHYFAPAEVRRLQSLPRPLRPRAFLECWTRKEAFIKARGDGLSLPLDSFSVTLGPGAPAALLHTAWSQGEPERWSLVDLSDPAGGFIAALASRSKIRNVTKYHVAGIVDNSIVSNQEQG
jgi:4'-phosphopantetheinyl transferase